MAVNALMKDGVAVAKGGVAVGRTTSSACCCGTTGCGCISPAPEGCENGILAIPPYTVVHSGTTCRLTELGPEDSCCFDPHAPGASIRGSWVVTETNGGVNGPVVYLERRETADGPLVNGYATWNFHYIQRNGLGQIINEEIGSYEAWVGGVAPVGRGIPGWAFSIPVVCYEHSPQILYFGTTARTCAAVAGTFTAVPDYPSPYIYRAAGSTQLFNTGCRPAPCPTGACCLATGGCIIASPAQCANVGGVYKGNATDCETTVCPTGPRVRGRCCKPNGDCILTNQLGCNLAGGVYGGDGTNCNAPCPQPPTAACCLPLPMGGCVMATQLNCASKGGTWHAGEDCFTIVCNPKPVNGACCLPDGTCRDETFEACNIAGGAWRGGGTVCTPGLCSAPLGACCNNAGHGFWRCNDSMTQAACLLLSNGFWYGPGTTCEGQACPLNPIQQQGARAFF